MPAEQKALGAKIQKAGFAVLAAHLCIRLAGMVGKNIIPNYYDVAGNTIVADVFSQVYDGVLNVPFLIGEQCLLPAYLPVFTKAKSEHGEARAWRYTSTLFNLQFLILLLIVAAFIFFPEFFGGLLTKWKADDVKSASRHGLFVQMLPYAAPGLIGLSLASLTASILNGYKEFFFAAFGDAALKLAIVGGAVLGCVVAHWVPGKPDWRFIAGGAVAGGTLSVTTHLLALGWRRVKNYQLVFDLTDPYLRTFFILALPLFGGIVVSQLRDAIIRRELTMDDNLPTYWGLGQALNGTVQFLVPYTLSIALLPFFCDMSARNDNAQLGSILTKVIRMLVWFFVPVAIAFAAAALPLLIIFFSGKNLQSAQLVYPALVMRLFAIQLPFAAIEMMVLQAFFSNKRVIAPTLAGFAFSALSAAVTYVGVEYKFVSTPAGVLALAALSMVGARILKSILLVAMLRWNVPVLPVAETVGFALRVLVAGGAAGGAAFAASKLIHGENWVHQVAKAGVVSAAAFGVFVALSLILKLDEPKLCLQWALEKVKRKRTSK